jgi:hypothetical protein
MGNIIYSNIGIANNVPFAAAMALFPIAIMAVYLLGARALGAFEDLAGSFLRRARRTTSREDCRSSQRLLYHATGEIAGLRSSCRPWDSHGPWSGEENRAAQVVGKGSRVAPAGLDSSTP